MSYPSQAPDSSAGSSGDFDSRCWTETDSAAGFTLRYLAAVHGQLMQWLGSQAEAETAMQLILNHLVKGGFRDRGGGRLRDHLLKASRGAAKTLLLRRAERGAPGTTSAELPAAGQWLEHWRDAVLGRVWRDLERIEHANPSRPIHAVGLAASRKPNDTPEMLAVQIAAEGGVRIDGNDVARWLPEAQTAYHRRLREEIRRTLDQPDGSAVEEEIRALGLGQPQPPRAVEFRSTKERFPDRVQGKS